MKIYKVYQYASTRESFFTTKKKANDFIRELLDEHKHYERDYVNNNLKKFMREQNIYIETIDVDQ